MVWLGENLHSFWFIQTFQIFQATVVRHKVIGTTYQVQNIRRLTMNVQDHEVIEALLLN